ncbi:MAG: OmpA family protein [Bacteroidota bacterium]
MKKPNIFAMIIAFSVVFFFCSSILSAQDFGFTKGNFPGQKKELRRALRNIKKGDRRYSYDLKGKYAEALDYYLLANNFNPNCAMLNYRIGVCYLESFYKNTALLYLENANRLNSHVTDDLPYYLGLAYQYNYQFDKAIACYQKYYGSVDPRKLANESGDLDTRLAEITKRIEECKSGKIIYSKPNRLEIMNLGQNVNSLYDDYCPVVNKAETVMAFTSRRKGTSSRLNHYDFLYYEDIWFTYFRNGEWTIPENPGPPINGKTNDATSDMSEGGDTITIYKNYKGEDLLVELVKQDGGWSKPRKLTSSVNYTGSHQPSSSYTSDRQTIYFISDKEGGVGGSDIYYSKVDESGKWGEAVNIGPVINTPYDEEGVCLLNDTTMYFSSKGHNTVGGYDIFLSRLIDGKWTAPVNLGYPMNSTGDDIFLWMGKDGKTGYFNSDRQGGFGGHDIYKVQFTMSTEEIISNINPVSIHGTVVDEDSGEPVMANVLMYSREKDSLIASRVTNKSGKYDVHLSSGKAYRMSMLVKGCDDAGAKKKLFFGTSYSKEFNPIKLSDSAGMATVIYGTVINEKNGKPMQPNIEIIEKGTGKKVAVVVPDTLGNFNVTVTSTLEYNMYVQVSGCEHTQVQVVTENYTQSNIDGQIIKLENIYFDFDRSEIRPDAAEILNRHAVLFQSHKDWKILVEGHTDNMGTMKYNEFLSQKRAENAIEYLLAKGVKRNRFKSGGYGFNKPISTNETDAGRQLNRRVEFSIMK